MQAISSYLLCPLGNVAHLDDGFGGLFFFFSFFSHFAFFFFFFLFEGAIQELANAHLNSWIPDSF